MSHLAPVDISAVATPYIAPGAAIGKVRRAYARRGHFRRMWRRRKKRTTAGRRDSGLIVRRRRMDGMTDDQRLLAVMVPGAWHRIAAMREAAGVRVTNAFRDIWDMRRAGLVESVEDPDRWNPIMAFDGKPFGKRSRVRLYRLTAAGERARLLALLLV